MMLMNANKRAICAATVLMTLAMGLGGSMSYADHKKDWRNDPLIKSPIVKQAAIGAGIGAATGALTRETGILRGAGIGALTGAGTGLVDSSTTLKGKPLVRTTAKGAIIGLGAGAATNRSVVKTTAVGAGAGAGVHLIREAMNTRR